MLEYANIISPRSCITLKKKPSKKLIKKCNTGANNKHKAIDSVIKSTPEPPL